MHRLYLFLNVYCPSVTLHVNYCVALAVLLLNCVRATVSAIRPGIPSVCLFVLIQICFLYCIWLLINKDTYIHTLLLVWTGRKVGATEPTFIMLIQL